MPALTRGRRAEVCSELPEDRDVCHFMGQADEPRYG